MGQKQLWRIRHSAEVFGNNGIHHKWLKNMSLLSSFTNNTLSDHHVVHNITSESTPNRRRNKGEWGRFPRGRHAARRSFSLPYGKGTQGEQENDRQ